MICDAHVHMGYYARTGYNSPYYYSPRRVLGVLNRCGVSEFIVSSTCSQIDSISIDEIMREAVEMKRIAGNRAHIFFWLSWHLYQEDKRMSWLDSGLFEGVKFHELETQWVTRKEKTLNKILERINERGMSVMFHCGRSEGCCPFDLRQIARRYPKMHFNFAHCAPMREMEEVMRECANVWTDTAYLSDNDFTKAPCFDWQNRLMFGTDLPVWQGHERCYLTAKYRKYLLNWRKVFGDLDAMLAFNSFLHIHQ